MKSKTKLFLTRRALRDFADIQAFSRNQWGKRVARRYIADLEAGLERICDNPELLRPEPNLHPALRFYSVAKHLFVCDVDDNAIYLLTVLHASRDIPSRLHERSPDLKLEVEWLRGKLAESKNR
ncbi:MAG: type II toxin-antitoxin system RelE/ParE family toxin [Planctomycetales bacterium]|nr:type II toxin-antitoxin system RelE/ParE family toxin [Planctomycetales bacterium]